MFGLRNAVMVLAVLVSLLVIGCSSSGSPTAATTTQTTAPANLVATAGNGQVQLSWGSVSGATSYNAYYSTVSGFSLASATKVSGISGVSTTVTKLTNETPYYFVVTAVGSNGESQGSNQASATPLIPIATTPTLSGYVPSQYVAKLYTEGLGRAPDQAGWKGFMASLTTSGCSVSAMEAVGIAGKTFFDAPEFTASNPDAQSQVMAMVRAILNRDPSATDLTTYEGQLNAGVTPANVAAGIYTGAEFATLANTICTATYSWQLTVGSTAPTTVYDPDYGFGTTPAPTLNLLTSGISTYAALVSALSGAKSGSAVVLAQGAMIPVAATVKVPAGVTLETMGNPTPNHYTQMARLVRGSSFDGDVVQIAGGGTVTNVWIDGQRNILGYYKNTYDQSNIETTGGIGTVVASNKSSEPQGGSNMESDGIDQGSACTATFSGNLIVGYATNHMFPQETTLPYVGPSDGMTMYCENATIANNSIVDQTDVAIVIMGIDTVGVNQHSTISGNVIVSAGNSMNAALHSDVNTAIELTGPPSTNPATLGDQTPGTGQQYPCYAGTTFTNNTFWTGPNTAFDFGIGAGGRPYFATSRLFDGQCSGTYSGQGSTYTNNGTGILSANVKEGIAIAGMYYVTVTNDGTNPMNFNVNGNFFPKGLPARACPATGVVVETNHSTGALVYLPATSTADIDECTFVNNGT